MGTINANDTLTNAYLKDLRQLHLKQMLSRYIKLLDVKKKQAIFGSNIIRQEIDALALLMEESSINQEDTKKKLIHAFKKSYVFPKTVISEIEAEFKRLDLALSDSSTINNIKTQADAVTARMVAIGSDVILGGLADAREFSKNLSQESNLSLQSVKSKLFELQKKLNPEESERNDNAYYQAREQLNQKLAVLEQKRRELASMIKDKQPLIVSDDVEAVLGVATQEYQNIEKQISPLYQGVTNVESMLDEVTVDSREKNLKLSVDQEFRLQKFKNDILSIREHCQMDSAMLSKVRENQSQISSGVIKSYYKEQLNRTLIDNVKALLFLQYPECVDPVNQQNTEHFFQHLKLPQARVTEMRALLNLDISRLNFPAEFNAKLKAVIGSAQKAAIVPFSWFSREAALAKKLSAHRVDVWDYSKNANSMQDSISQISNAHVQAAEALSRAQFNKDQAEFNESLNRIESECETAFRDASELLNQKENEAFSIQIQLKRNERVQACSFAFTQQAHRVDALIERTNASIRKLKSVDENIKLERLLTLKQKCGNRLNELSVHDRVIAHYRLSEGCYEAEPVENLTILSPDENDDIITETDRGICKTVYDVVRCSGRGRDRLLSLLQLEFDLAKLVEAYSNSDALSQLTFKTTGLVDIKKLKIDGVEYNFDVFEYLQKAHQYARYAAIVYAKQHPRNDYEGIQAKLHTPENTSEETQAIFSLVEKVVELNQSIEEDEKEVENKVIRESLLGVKVTPPQGKNRTQRAASSETITESERRDFFVARTEAVQELLMFKFKHKEFAAVINLVVALDGYIRCKAEDRVGKVFGSRKEMTLKALNVIEDALRQNCDGSIALQNSLTSICSESDEATEIINKTNSLLDQCQHSTDKIECLALLNAVKRDISNLKRVGLFTLKRKSDPNGKGRSSSERKSSFLGSLRSSSICSSLDGRMSIATSEHSPERGASGDENYFPVSSSPNSVVGFGGLYTTTGQRGEFKPKNLDGAFGQVASL